jgi:hypothetical protein
MIEKIEHDGKLMALVLRSNPDIPEGVNFFTENESPLQMGLLKHSAGNVIKPHIHKNRQRIIETTYEALHINKGMVIAELFDESGNKVKEAMLKQNDTILLMSGAHGFRVVEDSEIVEIKQGPYSGQDTDKEILE